MSNIFLVSVSIRLLFGLIPESLEVFIFGGGLFAAAIVLRRFIRKVEKAKRHENLEKTIS